jgi:plasmid stability protein
MATLNVKNLPNDLAEKLRERASREHRSVTQQVIHILSVVLSEAEPL